jgi:uncharacterized membrane protein
VDIGKFFSGSKTGQGTAGHLTTAALVLLLVSGSAMLAWQLSQPVLDPPMTEFYLLGQNGQTELYPKTSRPGEPLDITYGFTNRENEPAVYHVEAVISGEKVGNSPPVQLGMTETHSGQVEIIIPDSLTGLTKVEFNLYRDKKPYRLLYLWIDVASP